MSDRDLYENSLEEIRLLKKHIARVETERDLLKAVGLSLINRYWHNKDTTSEFVGVNSSRTAPELWRKLDFALKLIDIIEET